MSAEGETRVKHKATQEQNFMLTGEQHIADQSSKSIRRNKRVERGVYKSKTACSIIAVRAPRFLLTLLILIIALTLTFFFKAGVRREPTYKEKTLTQWVEQSDKVTSDADEARAAIRAIGTNGIPFLLDLIRAKESPMKKMLRIATPQRWNYKLRVNESTEQTRQAAANAFVALGNDASIAVDDLIQIARTNPSDNVRYSALRAMRVLGAAAEPAIPFLIECLTNRIVGIRHEAALAIGMMHLQPEVCVPALTNRLHALVKDKNSGREIGDLIFALRKFGTNASSAAPTLVGWLDHPDEDVRAQVTNALNLIQPTVRRTR